MTLGESVATGLRTAGPTLVLVPADADLPVAPLRAALVDDGAAQRLLAVEFTRPARDWLADWQATVGPVPPDPVVVTTDEAATDLQGVTVAALASPADLTGIGMHVSKHVERWEAAGHATVFVLDSLTVLSQYVELHNLYRFLHVVTTRLDVVGARAQFYLDPTTLDDQSVSTLTSLFNAVVEPGDDGWTIRGR